MDQIKIKEASQKEIVGFGGGGKVPLGERSQEDLQKLALMAQQSNNKNLLRHFEGTLPSVADLQAELTKNASADVRAAVNKDGDARAAVNKITEKTPSTGQESDKQKADKA